MMSTLFLIRGLPGSGKSTLARTIVAGYDFNIGHYEADMFFGTGSEYKFNAAKLREAHEWCQQQTRHDLEFGMSVIVSNTFTQLWEMEPYLAMAAEFCVPVQIIECKGQWESAHGVPADKIEAMRARWETYPAAPGKGE